MGTLKESSQAKRSSRRFVSLTCNKAGGSITVLSGFKAFKPLKILERRVPKQRDKGVVATGSLTTRMMRVEGRVGGSFSMEYSRPTKTPS